MITPVVRSEVRVILGTVLQGTAAKYFIQELIGEGGQGWVFKASYDDPEGFPVVVKVLRPDAATKESLLRFEREAVVLRNLSAQQPSPYIVRFYDHGEAEFPLPDAMVAGQTALLPFTVLEYVHGESLQAILDRQRGQGLAVARARRLAREVAKALEILHAQGIVHRDLKPSNILLANEAGREVAKVTDFGLVKIVDVRATATQSLVGVSLSYAPPEQYEPGNARVCAATDVFSFAAILFELLCGREAFPAGRSNPLEALRLIATSRRPKLLDRATSLPEGLRARPELIRKLDELLERALAPEPHDRPDSIEPLWDAIEPLLRDAEGKALAFEATPRPSVASSGAAGSAPSPVTAASLTPAVAPPVAPSIGSSPSAPAVGSVTAKSAMRTDEAEDPRAWSWSVASAPMPNARLRDALIDVDARAIVAVTSGGVARWSRGSWSEVPLDAGVAVGDALCVCRVADGALLLAGDRGLVAFLHGARWDVRRFADPDVRFLAAAADAGGTRILVVGDRPSRGHAVAIELTAAGWRRTFDLVDLGALRSVSYLPSGVALACGDGGALVRIDEQGVTRLPWERTGHLRAVATSTTSREARAFAVGTGGHALDVGVRPPLRGLSPEVHIEKVMTTQDLLGACLDRDGIAWAVSANARVLRRNAEGTWRRITEKFPIDGNLMRIGAAPRRALVVAEDTTIIEGTLL